MTIYILLVVLGLFLAVVSLMFYQYCLEQDERMRRKLSE